MIDITWPRECTPPWNVTIVDTGTGVDITPSVLTITVTVNPRGGITADLLMVTDEHGQPLLPDGKVQLADDGTGYRKDTFRHDVSSMNIRPC